jgi:kynurenine formamidase
MYGGKNGFISKKASSISKGDSANTSFWQFPNHLGTHIDFPYHFFEGGQKLEDFPLDFWFFDGERIEIIDVNICENELLIGPENITKDNFNNDAELVLIKTGFGKYRSNERYWKENPGIGRELAEWLRNNFNKLRVIGLDTISVSSFQHRQEGRSVHKVLLNPEKPVLLVEDMDLSSLSESSSLKQIWICPLMVKGANGCPCTIIGDVK